MVAKTLPFTGGLALSLIYYSNEFFQLKVNVKFQAAIDSVSGSEWSCFAFAGKWLVAETG